MTTHYLKWAVREELIALNPCTGLELPSGGESRDRIPSPSEALQLVQALPSVRDRALIATACFAGLRRGELMGLEWGDVDLFGVARWAARDQDGTKLPGIRVRRAYDPKTRQFVAPKSKAGTRTLGIPELLVPFLAALDGTEGLVFPSASGRPFDPVTVAKRCAKAWAAAGLEPIGLHEARHAYASTMIAANVNIKTVSEWLGHSSITVTLDRYAHLLPGSGAAALGRLNTFLERELLDDQPLT